MIDLEIVLDTLSMKKNMQIIIAIASKSESVCWVTKEQTPMGKQEVKQRALLI